MKIIINPPLAIHQQGQREQNEDSIYPILDGAKETTRLFLVCDGVGGSNKGEVASMLTCEKFSTYFNAESPRIADQETLEEALLSVEKALFEHTAEHPYTQGMATTLTLLQLHEEGVSIAHIGDSRIYHIRDGVILYQTEDHSFVQQLVRDGFITEEEAKHHSKRNVITRAVKGTLDKGSKIEYKRFDLDALASGDYFFLCTDGILETIDDSDLCTILSMDADNQSKINAIEQRCQEHSKDNFAAYLIQLKSVEGQSIIAPMIVETNEQDETTSTINDESTVVPHAVDALDEKVANSDKQDNELPNNEQPSVDDKEVVSLDKIEEAESKEQVLPIETKEEEENKPFWKKAWFILLVVLVCLAVTYPLWKGGNGNTTEVTDTTTTTREPTIVETKPTKNQPKIEEVIDTPFSRGDEEEALVGMSAPATGEHFVLKRYGDYGAFGYVDTTRQDANFVISPTYTTGRAFVNGYAAVLVSDPKRGWTFIDVQGKTITDSLFINVEDFENNKAKVMTAIDTFFINEKGERIED